MTANVSKSQQRLIKVINFKQSEYIITNVNKLGQRQSQTPFLNAFWFMDANIYHMAQKKYEFAQKLTKIPHKILDASASQ